MNSPPGSNLQRNDMQHLDEMTLLLYLERQLDRERAAEVSAHMQECGACRTLSRALERESRLLTRAMLEEEEPLPARLAGFQQAARRSLQWIWMLTFGLAATGIYTLYTSYIEPVQNRLQDAGFGGTNLLGLLIFQGAFWKGWQSMISLVEVLALVTLGTFAAMILRRRLRRGSVLAVMLAGMCGALMLPAGASATDFRSGQNPEVSSGETIKGDVCLNGDRMSVDGTVNGDVFAFGRSLDVTGHVLGDVIVFAQSVHITGQVDGNVRTFANNLTVSGTVGRSVTIFSENLTIDKTGKVGRSITSFTNRFLMDGHVGQDLLAMNERLDLRGRVEGEIRLRAEVFTIDSTAQVGGPIHFKGAKPAEVSPQAKLASAVEYQHVEKGEHREAGVHYYLWRLLWSASFILYGLVLILLMPKFSGDCVKSAENVGASLGLGLLVGISAPIAAGIVCVTFVGIPLGILTFMLWLVMLFTAQIVVGGLIGRWILGPTEDKWGRVGRMALGMGIIGVIVPVIHFVPVLDMIFRIAAMTWGFGAITLTLYKRVAATPSIPIPPPVPALG
jgi:cytoskeletal protein CcmA (bactofilin family)/anti-sigma factor RsiW